MKSTPATLRLPAHRHVTPTRTRTRTRRIPALAYILVLLAIPVAVILGARAAGWWVSTGHTVPATALGADTLGVATTSGNGTGAAVTHPDTVTGSTTLQQILDAYPHVTAAEICQLFGAPADTPTATQLKTLAKNGNGFEITDLRAWLAARGSG